MARTDFSLANSVFNDFLFEPIGDDTRGVSISMFSGLARLQLDPWHESARFAGLPLDQARHAIAERIGQLNIGTSDAAGDLRAAERFVKLLPTHGRDPVRPTRLRPRVRSLLVSLVWLLAIAAIGILLTVTLGGSGTDFVPTYGDVPGLNTPIAR